ncbi:MAG: hypothetical protein WAS27_02630 [Candidatus Saccharimonadales bacterium]
MNIPKTIFGLVVAAIIYWFVSDFMSPVMRISTYETQKTYGSTIEFSVTMINLSPRTKEVYIGAADSKDVTLLVDGANASQKIDKDEAAATVTLAPFSNDTIKRTVTLTESPVEKKEPQVIASTVDALAVPSGQHSVRAALGSYTSNTITFGVR